MSTGAVPKPSSRGSRSELGGARTATSAIAATATAASSRPSGAASHADADRGGPEWQTVEEVARREVRRGAGADEHEEERRNRRRERERGHGRAPPEQNSEADEG
jgi:hypothetical protein